MVVAGEKDTEGTEGEMISVAKTRFGKTRNRIAITDNFFDVGVNICIRLQGTLKKIKRQTTAVVAHK